MRRCMGRRLHKILFRANSCLFSLLVNNGQSMYLLAVCSILWEGKMSVNWNESPFSFTPRVEKIQSTLNWQYFEMFMDSNLPLENLSKVPECFRNIATLLKMNLLYITSD